METLNPWDELLKTLGKDVEKIAKVLKDDQPVSLDHLEVLSENLKRCADVLDKRILSLKEENQ